MEELDYSCCKLIKEYRSNTQYILAKVNNINLSIKQVMLLKLLNGLKAFFLIYLIFLNKQVKRSKLFLKQDELLKNLKDEES